MASAKFLSIVWGGVLLACSLTYPCLLILSPAETLSVVGASIPLLPIILLCAYFLWSTIMNVDRAVKVSKVVFGLFVGPTIYPFIAFVVNPKTSANLMGMLATIFAVGVVGIAIHSYVHSQLKGTI